MLAGGLWFAFFISRVIRREAIKHPRIDTTLGTFLALVVRYGIIAIVLIAVLQKFGVQTASLVAVLGASALAVGLALQGTLANVAAGHHDRLHAALPHRRFRRDQRQGGPGH